LYLSNKIDFKPLIIFTGPSNAGKSYTSFIFYFIIKHISEEEFFGFLSEFFPKQINKLYHYQDITLEISPQILNQWLNKKVENYLKYLTNNENLTVDIEISAEFKKFSLSFSLYKEEVSRAKKLVLFEKNKNKKFYIQSEQSIELIIKELASSELLKRIFDTHEKQTLLLPPSRSALIDFSQSALDNINLGLYKEFIKDFHIIKGSVPENFAPQIEQKQFLSIFLETTINGLIKEQNGDLYYFFNNINIPISAAASSIKELAPFIIAINKFNCQGLSVLFEEPESHLHSHIIIELAKLIAVLSNLGCFFQITTHSDLFISQINNLIRLYNQPLKRTQNILKKYNLSEYHLLNCNKIATYVFKKDRNTNNFKIFNQKNCKGISLDAFDKSFDYLYKQTSDIDEIINYD